jgi:two-component system, chemotaxis family, protein-glutamate methylesterase/glutaminase
LRTVASGLPPRLEASVFVVLHIGNGLPSGSPLPEILTRSGPLPAAHPLHREQIRHGRIYVAPPGYEMLVAQGCVQLLHGARENRAPPAINPLFRSAADAYGGRVTGVILTGMMDDGVAGLAEIKRRGGVAVVQDPTTALFPSMPYQAMRHVSVDYIVPLSEIAPVLARLASTERPAIATDPVMECTLLKVKCPECHGPLWEERRGKVVQYRCRVGHLYSLFALAKEHRNVVERSLCKTVFVLEEAANIAERLARELGSEYIAEAQKKRVQAADISKMLGIPEPGKQ